MVVSCWPAVWRLTRVRVWLLFSRPRRGSTEVLVGWGTVGRAEGEEKGEEEDDRDA